MTRKPKKRDLYMWSENVHDAWTTFGNSKAAAEVEGIPIRKVPFPFLNTPVSLNEEESPLVLPDLAATVTVGVELACRVGSRCECVSAGEAEKRIESLHVFVAVRDDSHYEYAKKSSTFPHYGKEGDRTWDYPYELVQAWGDGFSIVSVAKRDRAKGFPQGARMRLEISGSTPVETNTREYVHRFGAVIDIITRFVPVEQGDIISLGRAGEVITLPRGRELPEGASLTATIAGVGKLAIPVIDLRSDDNYYTRARKGASTGAFI